MTQPNLTPSFRGRRRLNPEPRGNRHRALQSPGFRIALRASGMTEYMELGRLVHAADTRLLYRVKARDRSAGCACLEARRHFVGLSQRFPELFLRRSELRVESASLAPLLEG